MSFMKSHLGVDDSSITFKSGYTAETAQVAYVAQAHEGVPFINAVANIALKDNKILSIGSSFVNISNIAPSRPSVTVDSVIQAAEDVLNGTYNGHPTTLEYLVQDDSSAVLTHVIQIQNNVTGAWYEAYMDAHTGQFISVTDFVADAAYKVLPITNQALPDGLQYLVNPQDTASSPYGWHSDGTTTTNTTSGNNVAAYKIVGNQMLPALASAQGLVFNYTYDPTSQPTQGYNPASSITNAFYVINTVHDFTYRYGFTETSFNFQGSNFGKGGQGNDRVLISVQDPSGLNNANFATPPDGQPGVCRMYLFNQTAIWRDGAMENDIITHEMTHGITNRMTGGGTARCLQALEAQGLGEGWSDAMAEWSEQKSATINDYRVGQYVTNNPAGIRKYPYSTNPSVISLCSLLAPAAKISNRTTNPLRYSSLLGQTEEHSIGEVWANILHNVYAALVGKYGFNSAARTTPNGAEGNVVFLHLFLDGLALQPCNPTFLAARDAWIQADVNRYNGVNLCLLWKAFASRGMGVNAANYRDDSTVPSVCR
ncbi:hypothetical protein H0H92_009795 [Tricholoma furcatifolium]|nr:hypothetical protein H0H92_009795 [Tricholoma furcatifolium]